MVKLFTVEEMVALEKEADTSGLTYSEMMENAGKGIANEIEIEYTHLENKKIFALVGSGNNGGDALVALDYLKTHGWEACAYIVRSRETNDPLIRRLQNKNGRVFFSEKDTEFFELNELIQTNSVCIDGIFGTGIKLPLKGEVVKILSFIKNQLEQAKNELHIVAVDCPSGVDCDTGEVAPETLTAEITVTMAGMKQGLVKFPAAAKIGTIHFASIGDIEDLKSYKKNKKTILSAEIISQYLPPRPPDAHKGTFGTAYIIGGSINYTGAALLAGMAAYRIGAGLVTLAIPEPLHSSLAGQFPEATWVLLPHEIGVISVEAARVVRQNIGKATALLIGPGFGLEDTTREFLRKFLSLKNEPRKGKIGFIRDIEPDDNSVSDNLPLVIDADALKLISKIENWPELLHRESILTPHPGEMSVLTGLPIEEIQSDRIGIAQKYSKNWEHVLVLKGAYTVITAPDGQTAVVPIASSALARAGTGDVLAGLIVGLRAQGIPAFAAACAGAWIHANAGLLAAKRQGNTASVLAGDVLNAVPQIITNLEDFNQNNGTRYKK